MSAGGNPTVAVTVQTFTTFTQHADGSAELSVDPGEASWDFQTFATIGDEVVSNSNEEFTSDDACATAEAAFDYVVARLRAGLGDQPVTVMVAPDGAVRSGHVLVPVPLIRTLVAWLDGGGLVVTPDVESAIGTLGAIADSGVA